jgi:spoIIIJ-associated protein
VAHAEASAKTVDAAVTVAAAQLGLHSDQVDVEVLEEPVPSTFGFIGSPARVRVTPRTTSSSVGAEPDGAAPSSGAPAATEGGPAAGELSAGERPAGSGPAGGESAGGESAGGSSAGGSSAGGSSAVGGSAGGEPSEGGLSEGELSGGGEPAEGGTAAGGSESSGAGTKLLPSAPPSAQEPSSETNIPSEANIPNDATLPSMPASVSSPPSVPAPPAATEPGNGQAPAEAVDAPAPAPSTVPLDPATTVAPDRHPASSPATSPVAAPEAASSASIASTSPSVTEPEADRREESGSNASSTRSPRRTYKDEPIEPQMVEEDTERAGDFLEGLLDAMDVDGDITTWVDDVGGHIDLEGTDLDTLVGNNGETLDALQELTRLAVLRQSKRRVRLLIDINGFRARQREQLTSMVRATVEQVIRTREDRELQPMTPAERKIVHDAVAAIEGARTESLGEEPNRRVVIRPT